MSDDLAVVITEDVSDPNKDNLVVRACGVEKVLTTLNVCLVVGVEAEVEVVTTCDEDRLTEENIDATEVSATLLAWDWLTVAADAKVTATVLDRYGRVRGVTIVEEIPTTGLDEDGLIGLAPTEE